MGAAQWQADEVESVAGRVERLVRLIPSSLEQGVWRGPAHDAYVSSLDALRGELIHVAERLRACASRYRAVGDV